MQTTSSSSGSSCRLFFAYFTRPTQIYKKVKPLMDALEAAQEAKAAAIADLAKVQAEEKTFRFLCRPWRIRLGKRAERKRVHFPSSTVRILLPHNNDRSRVDTVLLM